MADTIREKIIQDAMTRVASILTTNGYNTNIGTNPQRALKTQDEDVIQTVIVIPRVEATSQTVSQYGKSIHDFPMDVTGAIAFNQETQDISVISEQIYGDLLKAMTNPASKFSTYVEKIVAVGGGGFEIPKNEEKYAGAIANFEITYKTTVGDPYSQ